MLGNILPGYRTELPLEKLLSAEELARAKENAAKDWLDIDWDERGRNLAQDFHRKVSKAEPESLCIVSTGRHHLPQLHRALVYKGFDPFIYIPELEKNENDNSALVWFAQYQLKYSIKPSDQNSVPALLIGDTHGNKYDVNLPSTGQLRDSRIQVVRFLPEQLLKGEDDNKTPDGTQLGTKLIIPGFSGRIMGNPVYMKVLDQLDNYALSGLETGHDFLVGH